MIPSVPPIPRVALSDLSPILPVDEVHDGQPRVVVEPGPSDASESGNRFRVRHCEQQIILTREESATLCLALRDALRGPCVIEGCDGAQRGHFLCDKHSQRRRRHGSPHVERPIGRPRTRKERSDG